MPTSRIRQVSPARPASASELSDRKARPSGKVEALLDSPLGGRLKRIRAGETALTLEEVPDALDSLLELNAVELRELVQVLGFEVLQLRHADGSPVRRLTPDYVLQLMGGSQEGLEAPLPTTVAEVDRRIDALRRKERSLGQIIGPAELQRILRERERLVGMRGRLLRMPRVKGPGQVGFIALASWDVGHPNPVAGRGAPGKYLGSSLLGHSAGAAAGISVSERDRHTGRRKITPVASSTVRTGLFTGGYSWEPDNKGFGASLTPANGAIGYSPFCGRHISIALPMVSSLCIGEQYIAIGRNLKRWSRELGAGYRTGPSFILGLRGDPLQHVTEPMIRWCFQHLDRSKRRRNRGP